MLFNQRIGLIEATEELKRVNVDTKTFTRPLIHDYSSVARYVVPSLEGEVVRAYTFADRNASGEAVNIRNSQYKNIYANDSTLPITELSWMFYDPPGPPSWVSIPTRVQVLNEDGVAQSLKTSSGAVVTEIQITQNTGNQIATCTLDIAGEYTVRYETIPSTAGTHYAEYPFYVVQQAKPKTNKTITEVINTVLSTMRAAIAIAITSSTRCMRRSGKTSSPPSSTSRATRCTRCCCKSADIGTYRRYRGWSTWKRPRE